jgi:K+:H+ antiporter
MLPVTALLILGASSLSEGLGLHAFLGAFLIGTALSGRSADHREAHDVMAQFTLSFFAPIYFVSMGMTTNYPTHLGVWEQPNTKPG